MKPIAFLCVLSHNEERKGIRIRREMRGKEEVAVLDILEPKKVFHFFEELCGIPHGSSNEKEISDYCVKFANDRGFEIIQDSINNIIIKKRGTSGYEDSEPVILQAHLDMVCEKTPDSKHDFEKDGLKVYIEDGYVKAKDTTLGGDDGIGVTMALAVLDSTDIPHPPIEVVLTVDEEGNMSGAEQLDMSVLKGRRLINLDSDEEGVLTAGCAGGIEVEVGLPLYKAERTGTLVTLKITGLLGGHSGTDIEKQRGNANKMMGRLLKHIAKKVELKLIDVTGGSAANVIASEATADILIDEADTEKVKKVAEKMLATWNNEFMGEESGLSLVVEMTGQVTANVCDKESTEKVIAYLVASPNGLREYSRRLEGLVETSLNMGVVDMISDTVITKYLIRSSVDSRMQELREELESSAVLAGGTSEVTLEYPAWQFDLNSKLQKIMVDTYKDMFGELPTVFTTHAGLECGLFLGKCPELECVSVGPDLLDIHSVNEKLDIASTERTWNYLKAVLAALK